MRENLEGIPVFVEAVEAGGFARAAERLALSRSAVGKTIARLEARLGVRLFHRTTSSLSLTEDGQLYYERCVRALEELRAGEAMLETGRREVEGRLKITMPILLGRYCAEPILLELAARHQALQLDLRFSDSVIDLIGEGFDLAIRNHAPGDSKALATRKLFSQRAMMFAAPSYLARFGTPADLDSLSDHEALVYWRNDRLFPWSLTDASGANVQPRLRWRLQFDNQEAIVDAALRGMGIAILPDWLVQGHVQAGRLAQILQDFSSVPVDTFAVWPATSYVPIRLRVAIDTLAAQLPLAVRPSHPSLLVDST